MSNDIIPMENAFYGVDILQTSSQINTIVITIISAIIQAELQL